MGRPSRSGGVMDTEIKQHYDASDDYLTLERWMSYWHQLREILGTGAKTMLELGVGPKILSNYLSEHAYMEVTTFDANHDLHPDVTGDARNLLEYFAPNSFDLVVAFQMLEHIPYSDLDACLEGMAKVTRGPVIISLPHWGYPLSIRIRLNKKSFAAGLKITRPYEWPEGHPHFWEIGAKGYPLKEVAGNIEKYMNIARRYFCPDNPYHYFFVCQKKDGARS